VQLKLFDKKLVDLASGGDINQWLAANEAGPSMDFPSATTIRREESVLVAMWYEPKSSISDGRSWRKALVKGSRGAGSSCPC
jgi:hypothetical protein